MTSFYVCEYLREFSISTLKLKINREEAQTYMYVSLPSTCQLFYACCAEAMSTCNHLFGISQYKFAFRARQRIQIRKFRSLSRIDGGIRYIIATFRNHFSRKWKNHQQTQSLSGVFGLLQMDENFVFSGTTDEKLTLEKTKSYIKLLDASAWIIFITCMQDRNIFDVIIRT